MRYLIYSFTLLVLFSGCKKPEKTFHENGQLYEKFETDKEGLKHGLYERYFEDGTLAESTYFDHGNQHGKRTLYYPNGQIESVSDFENGKLHGKHLVYHDTGESMIDSDYKNSEIIGVLKKYYKNGNLQEEVTFANDIENGPFTEYYENGRVKWKGQYLNGDYEFGIIEHFDEDGELIKKLECDSMRICKTIWEKEGAVKG